MGRIKSGIAMVTAVLVLISTPALAMDAMTAEELDALSGRSGLTISFGGAFTTKASFNALSFGDGDGTGSANGSGWLVLKLADTNPDKVDLNVTVSDGTDMKIQAATTGASGYTLAAPHGLINIPANTPFFTFSLDHTDISMEIPGTVYIGMDDSAGSIGTDIGELTVTDLHPAAKAPGKEATLYIWAHEESHHFN